MGGCGSVAKPALSSPPPKNLSYILPNENKGLLAEFIDFIVYNKAWWMTPIILVLILMVGFIIFLDSSPILPFIYTVI